MDRGSKTQLRGSETQLAENLHFFAQCSKGQVDINNIQSNRRTFQKLQSDHCPIFLKERRNKQLKTIKKEWMDES